MNQLDKWTKQIPVTEGLKHFLQQDSILLTEENLNMIEKEAKQAISNALNEYGSVFIKFNGKAPTDSYFLVNDLRCYSLEDVLVLLKGSSRFDLKEDGNSLLVKKWITIEPKEEFRCYVINKTLKGIRQRHLDLFMDYQSEDLDLIKEKINHKLKEVTSTLGDGKFIIDVANLCGKVKILDIEHVDEDEVNDLILFNSWDDLNSIEEVKIKCIEDQNSVIKGEENLNRFPLELIESDMETLFKIINQN